MCAHPCSASFAFPSGSLHCLALLLSGALPLRCGRGAEGFSFKLCTVHLRSQQTLWCLLPARCTARQSRIKKNSDIVSLLCSACSAKQTCIEHNYRARLEHCYMKVAEGCVTWSGCGKERLLRVARSPIFHSIALTNVYWALAIRRHFSRNTGPLISWNVRSVELTLQQDLPGWVNVCCGRWWPSNSSQKGLNLERKRHRAPCRTESRVGNAQRWDWRTSPRAESEEPWIPHTEDGTAHPGSWEVFKRLHLSVGCAQTCFSDF